MPFARVYTQWYINLTKTRARRGRWRCCEHAHTLTGRESKHVLLIDIKDILNFVDN